MIEMRQAAIPRIDVVDLSLNLGKKEIIKDAYCSIEPGAKVAIVGTNGAGKSTLLKAIASILPAAKGAIQLDGRNIATYRDRERAQMISYVSQEELPSADLTVFEMVTLGRIPHRPPWAINPNRERHIVIEALEAVGMVDKADYACDQLSGGEKRRAMIARGLAQRCPVLILDEPTNHLDIAWTLDLLNLLSSLPMTVITAMHDLDVVLRYFDKVALIHDHTIASYGSPTEVICPQTMADAFKVEARHYPHPETKQPHLLITQRKDKR